MPVENLTLTQTSEEEMSVKRDVRGVVEGCHVCYNHTDSDTARPGLCKYVQATETTLTGLYPGGSYTVNVTSLSNNLHAETVTEKYVISKYQQQYEELGLIQCRFGFLF